MKLIWMMPRDYNHALVMIEFYNAYHYVYWKRYDDNIWHDFPKVNCPKTKDCDSFKQCVDKIKLIGYREISLNRAIFNEIIFGGKFFKGFQYHIRKRIANHVEREFNQSKNVLLSMCEL